MSFIPDMTLVFDSLGWAVLHSIWQGALAAFVVWMFRVFTSEKSADLRYMLGFTTLAALMGAFMITFFYYFNAGTSSGETTITLLGLRNLDLAAATANGTTSPLTLLLNSTNLIGSVWAICFAILGARYLAAFKLTHKLRTSGLSDIPNSWQHKFDRLARNCGISVKTRAYISEHVSSPITFGFFKPIVLVPTWFFTGMDSEQCEVVLLHEMAHIRRHDYIANILQIMIKTVFFFHPAVQYISKTVDADREDACDDIAVNMTRDPESLARALGAIRIRAASGGGVFALSADGRDAPLMHRLKRLVGTPVRKNQTGAVRGFASTSMLAISCALVMVLGATQSQAHPQSEVDAEVEARAHELANEWKNRDSAKLAGAPENQWPDSQWKAKSYNYGTFVKDGKSFKIKTGVDGKSWIKMDGNWHDIANHPEWNIVAPQPPRAPSFVVTPPTVPTVATPTVPSMAPVPPISNTYSWNSGENQQVLSELARDMARDQQELAEELAEAQREIAEQMAELQVEHARELAEAQKELAEHLEEIKNWDSEDKNHPIEDQEEFQREMEELQRDLAREQAELQRELAEEQREYKREMAELHRTLQQEQRELQQEIQREQRDIEREVRNSVREQQRAEVERVKADKNAKRYEEMREKLIPVLMADGYMNSEKSKVKIKLTSEDIFINGEKLANNQEGKYCDIISKYVDRKGDVKLIVFKPGYMHVEAKGKNGHSSYTFNDEH